MSSPRISDRTDEELRTLRRKMVENIDKIDKELGRRSRSFEEIKSKKSKKLKKIKATNVAMKHVLKQRGVPFSNKLRKSDLEILIRKHNLIKRVERYSSRNK